MKHQKTLRQGGSIVMPTVLVLLVGMTLLAFFANRSLIFEQKTSANQTRSTKAMEAAEAGLEWALANLNYAKKVNASCTAITSPTATDKTFRDRYLDPDNNGTYGEAFSALTPACTQNGNAWNCSCPTSGDPSYGTGANPVFNIRFNQVAGEPLMVEVVSTGCTSPGKPCVSSASTSADATATVRQMLKIQPGLATPPAAPLTAKGDVDFGSNAITVTNTDSATNGITINAGGSITTHSSSNNITTVPGTPPDASLVGGDASLSTLSDDQMFKTFFGQSKTAFKESPTTKQITCPSNCNSTLESAVLGGANVIWVNGAMDINSNLVVGSVTKPVILVVDGDCHLNGGVVVFGVLYCTADLWDNTGGGNATIRGAAIAEGSFTATGTPNPTYDPEVLSNLKTGTGQFVKVPGSWRDF